MAGVRKKRLVLSVFLFFIFAYIFFLLPIFSQMDFLHLLDIIFLNFNIFEELGISKFNPQYLILFFLMFYLLYHQQLSIINENTSFLSMALHKMKKSKIFLNLIIESGIDSLVIFISSVIAIATIDFLSLALLNLNIDYDINQIIKVIGYLVKLDFYMLVMLVLLRFLNIVRRSNYYTMIPYFGLVIFVSVDFTFGTSLITIAGTWQLELIYLLLMIVMSIFILVILYFKIYRGKEIYND